MSSNMHVERICRFCNSKFIARTTKTQYCSHNCSRKAYKYVARQEKIEIAKVEATITGKIRTKVNFPELAGKELLTIMEASALLNITHLTLRRWIKEKRIVSSRIGKKHLIKRQHLDALIQ
ncbi:helix-turn-helix domain-containing protein [Sediminibacterium sp.]|uniref:helix-turn-helix domain-containing protein n=1 Tax=Sediminibacterium sp. TaxID=1917865 RepID=UPI003F729D59